MGKSGALPRCRGRLATSWLVAAVVLVCLLAVPDADSDVRGGVFCRVDARGNAFLREESQRPTMYSRGRCLTNEMLERSLESYFAYGFPSDSLNATGVSGVDDRGGVHTTLIDILDTLAITKRTETFHTAVRWIIDNVKDFNRDVVVSVFETTIRILGGLLSAHMMMEEGVVPVDASHPYRGELLVLSVDLADRLLRAYHTRTGMPYGSVNLRSGVSPMETEETANAAVGTSLLEFGLLTRLTGDPKYLKASQRAMENLLSSRHPGTQLLGSHINISSAEWNLVAASIGTGQDSTLEYLLKYHIVSGELRWWRDFETLRNAALRYLRMGGLYATTNMRQPMAGLYVRHDSLASFYPGLLLCAGRREEGIDPLWSAHQLMQMYGVMPESIDLKEKIDLVNPMYPLRPEHAESIYYYYRASHDPAYLAMAEEFAMGLYLRCRTAIGVSPLSTSTFPQLKEYSVGVVESFLVSETLKYLYLIFEEGRREVDDGRLEEEELGSPNQPTSAAFKSDWIFTTEAHLMPNSYIWWSPEQWEPHPRRGECPPAGTGEADDDAAALRLKEARQRNIENLRSVYQSRITQDSETVRQNRFRKRFWLSHTVTDAHYYCQNHPDTSLRRLSDNLFR